MDKNDPHYKDLEQAAGMPPDAKTNASFTMAEVLDHQTSDALNRPIYFDRVHLTIRAEGYRDFASKEATEKDKRDYPREWAAFQDALARKLSGIQCIPGIKPSEIAMLRARRVHTLQEAAAIVNPDPEIADCVMKAQRWVAIESGIKPRIKLEAVA